MRHTSTHEIYRNGRKDALSDARARLDALARLLDSSMAIPGTQIRFGADALLNLIPGIGTLASKGLSGYLIWEARRVGVPTSMLLRMLGNIGVDFAIGVVPVVGWVADVFYRANLRNMALLRAYLDGPVASAATHSSVGAGPTTEGEVVRVADGTR